MEREREGEKGSERASEWARERERERGRNIVKKSLFFWEKKIIVEKKIKTSMRSKLEISFWLIFWCIILPVSCSKKKYCWERKRGTFHESYTK